MIIEDENHDDDDDDADDEDEEEDMILKPVISSLVSRVRSSPVPNADSGYVDECRGGVHQGDTAYGAFFNDEGKD